MRAPLALAVLASVLACNRPVTGRNVGATLLSELSVEPTFLRAGVALEVRFRATGAPPSALSLDVAGVPASCVEPERIGEGRYRCTHPGFSRGEVNQGNTLVVLEAIDEDGRKSVASVPLTIDFDCPRLAALQVSPTIAAPGGTAVVSIESSEQLREPPLVSFFGRAWEAPVGTGLSFSLQHPVTSADPSSPGELLVRLVDRAGNTSGDCGADGRVPFAVDHTEPVVDAAKVRLERGAPGTPAALSAEPGAFADDVGVAQVEVRDETSGERIAALAPRPDGSLEPTSLGTQTRGRVRVRAVDRFGRVSGERAVEERWRLSLGSGSTPKAGIHTAIRHSLPPPGTPSLEDHTLDFAPDLAAADVRAASVRARVGFELAGSLPQTYENVFWINAGYDRVGKAIVGFGGIYSVGTSDYFLEETLILRWDPRRKIYDWRFGQPPVEGQTPLGRGGHKIAFDDQGCGLLFGGYGLFARGNNFYEIQMLNDVWQLCGQGDGYTWRQIRPSNQVGNSFPLIRRTPLVYDPDARRYVVASGASNAIGRGIEDVYYLEPGQGTDDWLWSLETALPTRYLDTERLNHLVYWDPELRAVVVGMGSTAPFANLLDWWVFRNGQWSLGAIPSVLSNRQGFGYDYDTARRQLVFWGDNDSPLVDGDVWFLTGTATNSLAGWRRVNLNGPVPRAWPAVVYDPDREVSVAFAGTRFDSRFVTPEIYSIYTQPSWPVLVANVDLDAPRPPGIRALSLALRARGLGDADGVGPALVGGGGFLVYLWDGAAGQWVERARVTQAPDGGFAAVELMVEDEPARFVTPEGVVPVALRSLHPATEALEARLEVDLLDGRLLLSGGS